MTLSDIIEQLKKVATKDDIVQIKSTIIAQLAEIQQIRGKHRDQLKILEDRASKRASAKFNQSQQRPDADNIHHNKYGRAQGEPDSNDARRQNIVIHGLKVKNEDDLMCAVLDICQAIDVITFTSDIIEIVRLGVYNEATFKPPPPPPQYVLFLSNSIFVTISSGKSPGSFLMPSSPVYL